MNGDAGGSGLASGDCQTDSSLRRYDIWRVQASSPLLRATGLSHARVSTWLRGGQQAILRKSVAAERVAQSH
jgi:hypothetical protein